MPIKVRTGTRRTPGRFTMPKGTYLSNPSTAADGAFGMNSGLLPPIPQVRNFQSLGTNIPNIVDIFKSWVTYNPNAQGSVVPTVTPVNNPVHNIPAVGMSFDYAQAWKNFLNFAPKQLGKGEQPSVWRDPYSQGYFLDANGNKVDKNGNPVDIWGNPVTLSPNAPSNPIVGNTIGNTLQPGEIAYTTLANIDRTKTQSEINDMMTQMGYTQTYKYGVGVVYVPNPNATPTASENPQGIYGQGSQQQGYSSVAEAGASLAPNESYQSGDIYVRGGTPAASGESQYAVTYNNPNAKNDKHGKYKMVDYVTKDVNGNFVHVYRQELRKVYRRNSQKRNAGRGATTPAPQVGEANQLVTFRANFG